MNFACARYVFRGQPRRAGPLPIQKGNDAFAPGGGYEIQERGRRLPAGGLQDPNPQPLIPSGGAGAMASVNPKCGVPVSLVAVFLGKRQLIFST